jgi:adenine-specific DNA-methyltransferase
LLVSGFNCKIKTNKVFYTAAQSENEGKNSMPTLQWLNDDQARCAARAVPYRLLEEDPALSFGDPQSRNMLIQGDNLAALKALLPYYAGQVKCIYIDPPYNTGSAFGHYDDSLEHSTWLAMMYPRLELLQDLLAEDGSMWVSIDDNEGHYLKVILDEIFGRTNFIANVVWQKKYSPQNDAKWLSDDHDHILVYALNKEIWRPNNLPRTEEADARYKNPDNDPRGPWKSSDASVKTYSPNYDYPITTPSGRIVNPPEGRCWFTSQERMKALIEDNRIWFGSNGTNVPSSKKFLSEVNQGTVSKTIWLYSEVGHNQDAKKEIKELNLEGVFDTPKPEKLIQRIIQLATNSGDFVLDSFLGSGTAAAVAHKMSRRYIGIEMGEHAVTHCVPRLKKVIEGEQGGISKSVNWQGGGGFRFYRLGESIFDESNRINPHITYSALAAHVWFSETKTPLPVVPPVGAHGRAPDFKNISSTVPSPQPQKTPLLGVHNGTAYYLLFNGILGDKRPQGGNVLTQRLLRLLPPFAGPKVIYGEVSLLDEARLRAEGITFKKIPYELSVR